MPCHSDWGDWSDWKCEDYDRAKKEVDRLTQMLCACGEQMEKFDVAIPPNTLAWWNKHKEFDRKRREEEAAKKAQEDLRTAALKKLTAAEKKALGL